MRIYYLGKEYDEPLPLSYAEKPIIDKGIQGARLMLKEANQAGALVGSPSSWSRPSSARRDVVAKAKEIFKNGDAFIIADLEPADLVAVADLPEAKNSVIMNIRSSATALRQELCRQNVFHVIPDYAMRADALAQYLIWKKWPRWFVIRRDTPQDQDYLAMVKRSAARFGGKVVDDKVYDLPPGARNLDSGHQQIQAQIPMETEQAPTTTWCGSSTATTISATTWLTAPTSRARWSAPRDCRRSLGTSPIPNPAPCISRTLSRASPSASRWSATTPPGLPSARFPIRR
jgi:hypothetical protein